MYKYNETVKPPAPYCGALVSNFDSSRQATLEALLDTGSEISLIPLNVARRLGLRYQGTGQVQGITGERVARHIFQAFISIDQNTTRETDVMAWNEESVLLGRDILNHYHITLDGPNLTLTISG